MCLLNMRRAVLMALLMGLPVAATAADGRSQLERNVARDLPRFERGVDVSELSTHQLGAIYTTIYGDGSHADKRAHIRSIIGGANTLRGLLGLGRPYRR